MYTLTDKQLQIFNKLITMQGALIFAGCGFGKTLLMLHYLRIEEDQKNFLDSYKVLDRNKYPLTCFNYNELVTIENNYLTINVVAPGAVITSWESEIKKFGFKFDNLKFYTYETLSSMRDCEILILDEITKIKNPKTKRFKGLCKWLDRNTGCKVIGLTGTPIAENFGSLWTYSYVVDRGERLGTTYYRFKYKYVRYLDYNKYQEFFPEDSKQKILDLIKDIVFTENVIPPKFKFFLVECDVGKEVKELYDKMNDGYMVCFDEANITCYNSATKWVKLHQIAGGTLLDLDNAVHKVHTKKLDKLRYILSRTSRCVIVVYSFVAEREMILSELGDKVIAVLNSTMSSKQREEVFRRFNSGELDVLLLCPRSTAHGINLQYSSNNLVWYSLSYSYEMFEQMNARICRPGQSEVANIFILTSNLGLESVIMKKLSQKRENHREIFALL